MAVFIYKAKPFDIPKVKAIENFIEKEYQDGGKAYADKIREVTVKGCESDAERLFVENLKKWLGCYFHKHLNDPAKKFDETSFMQRLKMFVISDSKALFWHLFYAKRLDYQITNKYYGDEEKKEICFEMHFDEYKDLKYKPRLLLFQRRTTPEYIFG